MVNWHGSKYLGALAIFTCTIIGAGIFSLPYIASKAGFLTISAYFLVLTILTIVIHLLLAEVSRESRKSAYIAGYAEEYLGKGWRNFSLIVFCLSLFGALLAYLILGGKFLSSYFYPRFDNQTMLFTLIFFALGAALIYRGAKSIAKTDLLILSILLLIIFLFFTKGVPFINLQNLFTFNPRYLALPYGAVLFSLWGLTMVPEITELVERDRKKLLTIIISGIVLACLCYLSFVFLILGVSGQQTTPDAISGFAAIVGDQTVKLGFIFGFLAVFTSFIGLGLTLKKIFQFDLKLTEKASWAAACFPPVLFYLIGINNFVQIISLTGAITLGLEAVIVILIYKNFLQKRFQLKAPFWIYPLACVFLIGMALQIFSPVIFK